MDVKSNNKILYITYDGLTDPLGQAQILPYLVRLSDKGYKFTILSFEKKERFKNEKKIIEEITKKSGIQWKPIFFTKKPAIISKIYDRWRMKRQSLKLQRLHSYDLIHCRSYIAAEMGLLLKKKFNTRFLFDMRGLWADEKVDNGQWNLQSPFYRKVYKHYKKREEEFLLHADAIISLTQAAKEDLLKKEAYKRLSIDVIPCCADLEHFNFENVEKEKAFELRKQLGIPPDQKIISYLGSIGGWYMTKEMFSFYKRLLQKYPSFTMLFLTKDGPSKVMSEASLVGIPKDKLIVTYVERKNLPIYLSICDCSIFFIRTTYSKIATSPTKHGELMGMGIPVICNDIGDTGSIIRKSGTGLVVDSFNDEEYDRIINQFPKLFSLDKKHIRQAAFEYFDLKKGIAQYQEVYKRVFSN